MRSSKEKGKRIFYLSLQSGLLCASVKLCNPGLGGALWRSFFDVSADARGRWRTLKTRDRRGKPGKKALLPR